MDPRCRCRRCWRTDWRSCSCWCSRRTLTCFHSLLMMCLVTPSKARRGVLLHFVRQLSLQRSTFKRKSSYWLSRHSHRFDYSLSNTSSSSDFRGSFVNDFYPMVCQLTSMHDNNIVKLLSLFTLINCLFRIISHWA